MSFQFTKEQRWWIDALRSGKYKQGMGVLCGLTTDGKKEYCCLGVLADHFVSPNKVKFDSKAKDYGYDQEFSYLPSNIKEALYLRSNAGEIDIKLLKEEWRLNIQPFMDGTKATLAMLNDEGFTFTEIADLIEENPEAIFTNHE